MHPLAPNLSDLTMDELMKKYNELCSKFQLASRVGSGGVVYQMQLLIETYRAEIARRHQQMLDEASKKSPNFKDIIDIR